MPGLSKVTATSAPSLPRNGDASAGSMPLMVSALWPLSVATNFTVSPGATFISAGSNTIAPSAPLFNILTSTSAAKAPPAMVTRTAAVASIIILRVVVLHVFRRVGRFDGGLRELAGALVAPAQVQA